MSLFILRLPVFISTNDVSSLRYVALPFVRFSNRSIRPIHGLVLLACGFFVFFPSSFFFRPVASLPVCNFSHYGDSVISSCAAAAALI